MGFTTEDRPLIKC